MKKLYLLLLLAMAGPLAFSSVRYSSPAPLASAVMVPIGNSGMQISLLDLSRLSVRDYQALTGKKMSLGDKITFRMGQRQLRRSINPDGTLNNKLLAKVTRKYDGSTGFHAGGFLLGLLLSLVGVLIAYLIDDDKKRNRVKWAWIGALVALLLWGAVII